MTTRRRTVATRRESRLRHKELVLQAQILATNAISIILKYGQFKTLATDVVHVRFRKKPSLWKQFSELDRNTDDELEPGYSLHHATFPDYQLLEDGSIACEIHRLLNQETSQYNRRYLKEFNDEHLEVLIDLLEGLWLRLAEKDQKEQERLKSHS
jgi:hypothetical protein